MPDKKLTNYDRIRNMSVEEMVEFMDNIDANSCSYCIGNCASMSCKDGFKKYLESEVDNNAR